MPRYIDADALKEKAYVMEYKDEWHMTKYGEFVELADVENAPTADVVERKKGKWMKHNDRACWYCSECKEDDYYAYSWDSDSGKYEIQDHYCPNCGAEMKGSEE